MIDNKLIKDCTEIANKEVHKNISYNFIEDWHIKASLEALIKREGKKVLGGWIVFIKEE
jgi:hypothetical protein